MAATGRRRVRGDRGFRRLLRKLPTSAREQMLELMDDIGHLYLNAMRADAPVRTGALRAGLGMKVLRSMKLRVGYITKPIARRLFYGWIFERGRKAQTVTVRRRTPSGGRTQYRLRVKAMPARSFVFKQRRALNARVNPLIKNFWTDTLERAARGVDFDD